MIEEEFKSIAPGDVVFISRRGTFLDEEVSNRGALVTRVTDDLVCWTLLPNIPARQFKTYDGYLIPKGRIFAGRYEVSWSKGSLSHVVSRGSNYYRNKNNET